MNSIEYYMLKGSEKKEDANSFGKFEYARGKKINFFSFLSC